MSGKNAPDNKMDAMLKILQERREDRGLMASVRAGLKENTRYRAWPFLARFCNLDSEKPYEAYVAKVFTTVAGLYASHPQAGGEGSLGRVCRRLCREDEEKALAEDINSIKAIRSDKIKVVTRDGPMARRLRQLIDSDRGNICERVVRIVLYAKGKGIPVDYRRLGRDLLFWGDRGRRSWAQDFWGFDKGTEGDKKREEAS